MIATYSAVPEVLERQKLYEILGSPGPCITLVLPPYHPGEPAKSPGSLLRANLQDAARQLAERGLAPVASAALLNPLQNLADDPSLLAGSRWGRTIFRSRDVFRQFQLTQPCKASLTVAGCFAIRRLLPDLSVPRTFYILGLSKDRVTLHRCTDAHMETIALPEGVPATLEEALALEPPDHDLENRSTAGGSAGAMHRIRFGTGSGRETQHTHLADYYKIVDRGIHKLLHDQEIPLLLSGVDEDTASYRAVNTYRSLVTENLRGSPDFALQEAETVSHACSILRAEALRREAKALMAAKERTAPGHSSTDQDTIPRAAFEGRVHQLYVEDGAEISGVFERGTYRTWGTEDLLNLAVVETILHRGEAFELPNNMMPDGVVAFAIMRF